MLSTRTRISAATALLAAVVTAITATGALSAGAHNHIGAKTSPVGQQLNGTWTTMVTLTDAPPNVEASFHALDTFLPGGGLLVSSSVANPSLRGLAHGEWVRTGNRQFASTFIWFRFDTTGAFVGMQRVRRTLNLAQNLHSFQATDIVEIIAPTGAVVATVHGTEAGTRLSR
jgi:hypothetical protein